LEEEMNRKLVEYNSEMFKLFFPFRRLFISIKEKSLSEFFLI